MIDIGELTFLDWAVLALVVLTAVAVSIWQHKDRL